ncbi:MAG: hypothetical protein Greene071421_479 [Parcubacteria group bacterium Greene0714_21]|nr:MAG: hypothetical protein Greene041639_362 [Parcubacteria group bacterium Greene0416_39]TSC97340.1 MAG: hypothetical protein Greene101447_549 [Parcubacteria group bacterium Greene1014_47]TSD03934.1 MAG: hypothetical protein Greene071421_479 [Parcubacteria group bacterium Greene0714_21]
MDKNTSERVISLALNLVGSAVYKFVAQIDEAPHVVNCQTLIAWIYRQCGTTVPDLLSEQLYCGIPVESLHTAQKGDWVFTKGRVYNFYDAERARNGVGHIGLVVEDGTVLHASFRARTVVKEPIGAFIGDQNRFRGVYRLPHMQGYF